MATSALADLFSGTSPSPPPPRRSPTPSSPSESPRRLTSGQEALFLSPSDTPARQVRPTRRPSPVRQPDFGAGPARNDTGPGDAAGPGDLLAEERERGFDGVYRDPLDLSAAYGEVDEGRGVEGDEGVGKKRRVMAKVDVDRLMGENGFPALMKSAKRFKPRGKGKEEKDLRDLLNVYQLWAHGMFPKGDFEGTIKRVETICRSRRMEIAMRGYREAFYPPPASPERQPGEDDSRGLSPSRSQLVPNENDHDPDALEQFGINQRSSSQPLFDRPVDGDDMDDLDDAEDDGPDFDELLAMEEMEREQRGGPTTTTTAAEKAKENGNEPRRTGVKGIAHDDDGAPPPLEEEDEWEGLYD